MGRRDRPPQGAAGQPQARRAADAGRAAPADVERHQPRRHQRQLRRQQARERHQRQEPLHRQPEVRRGEVLRRDQGGGQDQADLGRAPARPREGPRGLVDRLEQLPGQVVLHARLLLLRHQQGARCRHAEQHDHQRVHPALQQGRHHHHGRHRGAGVPHLRGRLQRRRLAVL